MVITTAIHTPPVIASAHYGHRKSIVASDDLTIPWAGRIRKPWAAGVAAPSSKRSGQADDRQGQQHIGGGAFKSIQAFATCVKKAATLQNVPAPVLLGIIHTESGWNGAASPNTNGSHDLGIMQVNGATWARKLARDEFHTDSPMATQTVRYMLMYDDCYNINVGAWIFGLYYRQAHGNILQAVGWYNSHDPIPMHQYQDRFIIGFDALFGRELERK